MIYNFLNKSHEITRNHTHIQEFLGVRVIVWLDPPAFRSGTLSQKYRRTKVGMGELQGFGEWWIEGLTV